MHQGKKKASSLQHIWVCALLCYHLIDSGASKPTNLLDYAMSIAANVESQILPFITLITY